MVDNRETKPILMEVEPSLWTEAKIQALREGINLRDFVAQAIREKLSRSYATTPKTP